MGEPNHGGTKEVMETEEERGPFSKPSIPGAKEKRIPREKKKCGEGTGEIDGLLLTEKTAINGILTGKVKKKGGSTPPLIVWLRDRGEP